MKTDDEVRLIFQGIVRPDVKHRGSLGPFNWFLAGFRACETEHCIECQKLRQRYPRAVTCAMHASPESTED